MAARKSGLGKGLDSLIPNKVEEAKTEENAKAGSSSGIKSSRSAKSNGKKPAASGSVSKNADSSAAKPRTKAASVSNREDDEEENQILVVPLNQVEPNRAQPRRQFDPDALQDLADSIKIHGILQPLLVSDKEDYYEIIAGERRWRAAKMAGLKEVPIIVKDLTGGEIVEISLIENIQREDLNPIEEARAYDRLLNEFHLKQEEIAQRVSKSRSAVTNSLRLLRLHPEVQEMLIRAELTAGHARALLAVDDSELQLELAQKIVLNHLSVRDVEKMIKSLTSEKKTPPRPSKDPVLDAIYRDIAGTMEDILGTRVEIHPKKDKGKIEIAYYSQDELNRILELFQSIESDPA